MVNWPVDFDIYCAKCKYSELSESDDPCFECLEDPYNEGSRIPIKYEEKVTETN